MTQDIKDIAHMMGSYATELEAHAAYKAAKLLIEECT